MLGGTSGFGQGAAEVGRSRGDDELSSGIWVAAGGDCEGSRCHCDEIFSRGRDARGEKGRWDSGYAGGSRRGRDGAGKSGGPRARPGCAGGENGRRRGTETRTG